MATAAIATSQPLGGEELVCLSVWLRVKRQCKWDLCRLMQQHLLSLKVRGEGGCQGGTAKTKKIPNKGNPDAPRNRITPPTVVSIKPPLVAVCVFPLPPSPQHLYVLTALCIKCKIHFHWNRPADVAWWTPGGKTERTSEFLMLIHSRAQWHVRPAANAKACCWWEGRGNSIKLPQCPGEGKHFQQLGLDRGSGAVGWASRKSPLTHAQHGALTALNTHWRCYTTRPYVYRCN